MKSPLTPHITEKSYRDVESSVYTFKLNTRLSKLQVKSLVEKEFKVSVVDVRTINLPGKVRKFKGVMGKTSTIRKAIVQLKKGDKIAAFDVEETKETKEASTN